MTGLEFLMAMWEYVLSRFFGLGIVTMEFFGLQTFEVWAIVGEMRQALGL